MKRYLTAVLLIGAFALPSFGALHAVSRTAKAAKKPAIKSAQVAKRVGLFTFRTIF